MVRFGWLEDLSLGSWVQDKTIYTAMGTAYNLTIEFHKENPNYQNKDAYYAVGLPRNDEKDMIGIYFVDDIQSLATSVRDEK